MELKIINNRESDNNTYILIEDEQCLIIDPSCQDGRIENIIQGKQLQAILLTHGHYDHLSDVNHLLRLYPDVDVYCHENDWQFAYGDTLIFNYRPSTLICKRILKPIEHKDYQFGKFNVYAIHTPGHSPGEMMYQVNNMLFSGDMIFKGCIGREDLPGGSMKDMIQSIKYIHTLDPHLVVYPGHGESTTLKEEFLENPYLR